MQTGVGANGSIGPPPSVPPPTPPPSSFSLSSFFGSSTGSRIPRRPVTSSGATNTTTSATTSSTATAPAPTPAPTPATEADGPVLKGPLLDSETSPSTVRAGTGTGTGTGSTGTAPAAAPAPSPTPALLRKNSLGRKPSLGDVASTAQSQEPQPQSQSIFRGLRRRANSVSVLRERERERERDGAGAALGIAGRPNSPPPEPLPTLPDYALSSATKVTLPKDKQKDRDKDKDRNKERDAETFLSPPTPRSNSNPMDSGSATMLNRSGTLPVNGFPAAGAGMMPPPSATGVQGESSMVHQHIQEMANKRISTLEYLRKAHEGRVYWFNTLLFDKPDLGRMPYFDTRRLARRATNYLLLGLSLPIVVDLNSNTPMEFLRALNLLLTEFDSFQSLHPETGSGSSGLGRARIPNLNVFRRATPSAKARRSSSSNTETLYETDAGNGAAANGAMMTNGGGGSSGGSISSGGPSLSSGPNGGGNGLGGSASVVSFGQSEADLLPGEEYVHLLTPSLPFDPDFFETFATLCDVLIDAYTRLLSLLPTPRECNAAVAELFTKADARVRKIIVQGIVKEFEDSSRNGVRTEVATVGKIVLSGLM